ncbi:SPOSA6832_05014 [Sporobolomyces salmonicolor]|uniref:SPOSA6832_05014-mRNA-1:cds n=1 Tax=Sporidiobolus salmonicolor TaxID=5005 RepID=A0A0D6ETJ7_SPOSA|nr:SPOSA6832_05014 [Sporobolomyces salmonicolor]
MLVPLLKLGAAASIASTVFAQLPIANDIGNGVHVPGAIPANLDEPLQHHLAFAGSTGMTVSWASFNQIQAPTVWYGPDPANLNMKSSSNQSATYPTSRTYDNHVALTGLKPATKYYYKGKSLFCIALYSFTTSRAAGDMTPFTLASFADLGLMGMDGLSTKVGPISGEETTALGANDTNTIQSLLELKDSYEFMHHYGDIAWGGNLRTLRNGQRLNPANSGTSGYPVYNESFLEQFFDQMQPVTAEKPWSVAILLVFMSTTLN